MRTLRIVLTASALVAACAPSAPTARPAPSGPVAIGTASARAPRVAAPCRPSAPAAVPLAPERSAALDALLAGAAQEAARGFERVVRANPRDLAASRLYAVATAALARRTAEVSAQVGPAVPLSSIPLEYVLAKPVELPPGPAHRLERVSESRNLITDDADWFSRHRIEPHGVRLAAEGLPAHVASTPDGRPPSVLWHYPDHDIALYGERIVAFAPGKAPRAFDASSAARTVGGMPLEVRDARLVGRALVVQLAHNGYAREVGGKNGYVAAFDAVAGGLLWCSEPLVANSWGFAIVGTTLVTGYGFSAEPDHVVVLDLLTGRTLQRIPVRAGPHFLAVRDDHVLIRTYDHDYDFRLTLAATPVAPAQMLPGAAVVSPVLDAEARCRLDAVVSAIDHRDPVATGVALTSMQGLAGTEAWGTALAETREYLQTHGAGRGGIDLTEREIVTPDPPPWEPWIRPDLAGAGGATPPRVVSRNAAAADPVRMLDRPADPTGNAFIAPIDRGRMPPGDPRHVPSSYGFEDLRAVIPTGDFLLLVYGGRYLIVVRGDATEHVLDLEAYRHPPRATPAWRQFAEQDVTFARVRDGVIYVSNGGGSNAREVYGKKGFLSAIDLSTGRLRWRSPPLVSNATFELWGDWIVSGYGFTAEPDYLYLIRRATGEVGRRVHLDSGPDEVTVDGNLVRVEAYSTSHLFELVSP